MEASSRFYKLAIVAIIGLVALNGFSMYYAYYAYSMALPNSGSLVKVPLTGQGSETRPNVISISGTGIVWATPDVAQVTISVVTQSTSAAEAQQSNAATMTKVIQALMHAGVSKEDVKTIGYSLSPRYSYDGQQTLIGYECRNIIAVMTKNTAEVGKIIDVAVGAGANEVSGVLFTVSEEKKAQLMTDAIKRAVGDADSKAQAMSNALGVTITGKSYASISQMYQPYGAAYEVKASEPTPIIPGELQLTVTVQVDYTFA
jgi:uncharacterized protein YggE